MSTKIISPNVAIYVPSKLKKWGHNGFIPGAIITDKIGTVLKDRSVVKTLCSYDANQDSNYDNVVKSRQILVDNKGFTLTVPSKDEFGSVVSYYDYGTGGIWVEIQHPSISERIVITLPMERFLELVQTSGLNGRQINGKFSLIEVGGGGLGKIVASVEPETWANQNSIEKRAGELLTKRLSSNWIPGHLYVTRANKYILYLGELPEIFCISWGEKSWNLSYTSLDSSNGMKINRKVRLYVEINNLDTELPKSGTSIIDFVKDIFDDRISMNLYARDGLAKWTGGDLGEYLTHDPGLGDIGNCLRNLADNTLNRRSIKDCPEAFSIYPKILDSSEKVQREFLDSKKSQVIHSINNLRRYGNSGTKIPSTVTWDDLLSGKLDGWYGKISTICSNISKDYPNFTPGLIDEWKSEILKYANK